MSIATHLDKIIGHLGTAAAQRSWLDDRIIADHIDEALEAARAARAELNDALRRARDDGIALGHDQAEKYSSLLAGN